MAQPGSALVATAGPDAASHGRADPGRVVSVQPGAVSVADIVAVARDGASVRLPDEVLDRLARARAALERLAAGGRAVYGMTTGLGAAVDTRLEPADMASFQRRAVRARAVDVGGRLPVEAVRATLAARLAGLAAGASGISPGVATALAAMLNAGVHPVAHGTGSLGEADLAILAALALPLLGEGEAEWAGSVWPGEEAMRRAGIALPVFGPKDGLALLNANSFSAGTGALAVADLGRAMRALTVSAALTLEAFRANLSVIAPQVVALRAAPGQAAASARLAAILAGSDLWQAGEARRLQDPLSIRCVAPVHGALLWRLEETDALVSAELNGAGDSPAVLPGRAGEPDDILSTANFDTTALALSFEAAGAAASAAATLAAARLTRLLSGTLTGLPRFLARGGGSRSGFSTLAKSAAALEAEIRHLALPLGALTVPVADGIEDYAPMTPRIVAKTAAVARRLATLAAIELVVAAEAVELRGSLRLGRGTAIAQGAVRRLVEPLADDRPTGPDVRRVEAAIAAGAFEAGWDASDTGAGA